MSYPSKGGNGKVAEAIKQNIDILDYLEAEGYTFKLQGKEHYCNEMHGFCVDTEHQRFYDHKSEIGGSVIDIAMLLDGLSLTEAISKLRLQLNTGGDYTARHGNPYRKIAAEAEKKLVLPKPSTEKYSYLFAYLIKTRGIDPHVISDMIKRKMLYEEGTHHNCVFVGNDYDGTPKYASMRSTGLKKLAIDVTGSTKKVGWFVDNNAKRLFVCEAPIDAMSLMSMLKLGGKDYMTYSFLAQGGAGSIKTMEYHMSKNPNIETVYLAYDNDEAGMTARTKAREKLISMGFGGKIIDKIPKNNDFNDDLVRQRKISQPTKQNIKEMSYSGEY